MRLLSGRVSLFSYRGARESEEDRGPPELQLTNNIQKLREWNALLL